MPRLNAEARNLIKFSGFLESLSLLRDMQSEFSFTFVVSLKFNPISIRRATGQMVRLVSDRHNDPANYVIIWRVRTNKKNNKKSSSTTEETEPEGGELSETTPSDGSETTEPSENSPATTRSTTIKASTPSPAAIDRAIDSISKGSTATALWYLSVSSIAVSFPSMQ